MTKKHFEAIARDIREELELADSPDAQRTLDRLVVRLGTTFLDCNDLFDYNRFVRACGL